MVKRWNPKWSFFYISDIFFIWIQQYCLNKTVSALNSNNRVVKRLWCTDAIGMSKNV